MSNSLERRLAALENQPGSGDAICIFLHPDLAEQEKRLTEVRANCGPLDKIIAYGWKRPHPRYE
jgi:hypothetical protein